MCFFSPAAQRRILRMCQPCACWCCSARAYFVPQPDSEVEGAEDDLGGEPLAWTESLGSGGPLFYSSLLRFQASALQVRLVVVVVVVRLAVVSTGGAAACVPRWWCWCGWYLACCFSPGTTAVAVAVAVGAGFLPAARR